MEKEKMKIFLVKDLMNGQQLFFHKYYFLIIISFVALLSIYDIELAYFLYVLPVTLVHLCQNHFNYFGHLYGYRNFDTRDNSRNNIWLFPFILGEAWHNNHHHNPSLISTKVKYYEIDPIAWIIKRIY
jgi:stearoyl-CoA desaturase (delta-9 desaturase)